MGDVIKSLGRSAWREIAFPLTARDFAFSQAQAKHRYLFRDNELIESLGSDSPTYRYTIPFREDIVRGPYRHLFTEVYPTFLEACKDRSEGILEDPVHGAIQCKCVSFRELLDVGRKDGLDVDVEFIRAPNQNEIVNDTEARTSSLDGARDQALSFNEQSQKINWQQETPPEVQMDIFSAVSSIADRIYAGKNRIEAGMANVAFQMEKTTASIDRLKDPKLAPLRQQARNLQAAALDLHDELTKPPNVMAVFETVNDIGVIALAGALQMPQRDFLAMNQTLQGKLLVPKGTRVRYVRAKAA